MNEHILRASLEQGSVVSIIYQKGNIITRRNIRVLAMDETMVRAYCYLRRQIRVFRRENILAAAFIRQRVFAEQGVR